MLARGHPIYDFVEELYSVLETDPDQGLTSARATMLLAYHGHNALTPASQNGWMVLLLKSLFTGKIHIIIKFPKRLFWPESVIV